VTSELKGWILSANPAFYLVEAHRAPEAEKLLDSERIGE
jgi:hypothetical protein